MEQLTETARLQRLHENRYWRILLHYEDTLAGTRSVIDDPRFFLAPDGKKNPGSELEATLRAFFAPAGGDAEEHPVCRFVARYNWLREQLQIDPAQLPVSRCIPFETVMSDLAPVSATLVFPTYHMNNPASMFGHTLINIESDFESKLLSHAVNYSALTDETNGFLFAAKGLFGFYKGYYSIQPYYLKIQQYSDISQRDIWEYPLNLTKAEVRKLLMHLWEVRDIYADYYFFDENCAYNLLFLMEAARPSLQLTSQFDLWVLPIDTIKTLKSHHVIDEVNYRPSRATRIRHKIDYLEDGHQKLALHLIEGKTTSDEDEIKQMVSSDEARIRILDLAIEYLQYRYARSEIGKTAYQKRLLGLMKTRSTYGNSDPVQYDIPLPPRPDDIHETSRFSVGAGIRDGAFFQEIGYRPAFSDLTDTDYVHHQGTQIEFLSANLRYFSEEQEPVLENLDLIDIVSLSPRDRFFSPHSWKFRIGFRQKQMPEGDRELIFHANTGGGLAFFHPVAGLGYAFLEPELNIGGDLQPDYALGIGLSAGLLKQVSPRWKWHLQARKIYFEIGDDHRWTRLSFDHNIRIRRNHSLHLTLSLEKAFGDTATEIGLNWYIFF